MGDPKRDSQSPDLRPVPGSASKRAADPFAAPGKTDSASLTDGRAERDWKSIYPFSVWIQITVELAWLVLMFGGALYFLGRIAVAQTLGVESAIVTFICGNSVPGNPLFVWAATGAAGVVGGSCFAFKWLYHTVAKMRWHRDRVIWRFIVPPVSGALALFTALMIKSGIVPFLSTLPFDNPIVGASYGFFVGLFSDNLLAALQNLAQKTFGTVKDKPKPETTGKISGDRPTDGGE